MNRIILGDCLDVLKTLPDESVSSVATDPPYGLGTREPTGEEIIAYLQGGDLDTGGDFMQRQWSIPPVAAWKEVFRVLKPGGHLVSFGGTRTYDLISIGIRAAGFECRDTIAQQFGVQVFEWIQGSGFPKSASIEKHLVKQGLSPEEAAEFKGLGTALKPSWEPILVFRKPIAESTVAKQVLKTGTGAINIDACRVKMVDRAAYEDKRRSFEGLKGGEDRKLGRPLETAGQNHSPHLSADELIANSSSGRWPANALLVHTDQCRIVGTKKVPAPVINRFTDGMKPFGEGAGHKFESERTGDAEGNETIPVYECQDGCPVKTLDEQSGELRARGNIGTAKGGGGMYGHGITTNDFGAGDAGGASRFFTQLEPDAAEESVYECADGCPVKALDEQSGDKPPSFRKARTGKSDADGHCYGAGMAGSSRNDGLPFGHQDSGGASRFYSQFEAPSAPFLYAPKVSKAERDRGLPKGTNKHPCLKPLSVMRWLVRLVTPKGGTVLDPYAGSGSTLVAAQQEGFGFIGIERDPEFHAVAVLRTTLKPDVFDELEQLE